MATRIKAHHASLRNAVLASQAAAATELHGEDVWTAHLADAATLAQYAKDMSSLATDHWTGDNREWVRRTIRKYFAEGERSAAASKDRRRAFFAEKRKRGLHENQGRGTSPAEDHADSSEVDGAIPEDTNVVLPCPTPITVLDVGSCFNPFGK